MILLSENAYLYCIYDTIIHKTGVSFKGYRIFCVRLKRSKMFYHNRRNEYKKGFLRIEPKESRNIYRILWFPKVLFGNCFLCGNYTFSGLLCVVNVSQFVEIGNFEDTAQKGNEAAEHNEHTAVFDFNAVVRGFLV